MKYSYVTLLLRSLEALSDIERALSLTAGSRCRARALALCQRGLLRRKAGAEADARADFVEAADLGSAFAKKQVIIYLYFAKYSKSIRQRNLTHRRISEGLSL